MPFGCDEPLGFLGGSPWEGLLTAAWRWVLEKPRQAELHRS